MIAEIDLNREPTCEPVDTMQAARFHPRPTEARLVMMGGVLNGQRDDYNVNCDPEAEKIVLNLESKSPWWVWM